MIYVQEITVTDPDTLLSVQVAIYKDNNTGAMVGLDSSYLLNTDEPVYSPYDVGVVLVESAQ